MKKTLKIAVATTALLGLAGTNVALADAALAQKNGCLACHQVDKKVVGPSYKDVAAKYAGADAAKVDELAAKVVKGGVGVWGQIPMPPNAKVTPEDAKTLVQVKTRDKERWVKAMMIDELGMMEDESNPLINGLVTFGSFVIAGAVPLIVYLLGLAFPISPGMAFPISIASSGLALFALGAAKVMVTKLNPIRSGLEMLIVGGLAAGVAYVVGALLKGIGG